MFNDYEKISKNKNIKAMFVMLEASLQWNLDSYGMTNIASYSIYINIWLKICDKTNKIFLIKI